MSNYSSCIFMLTQLIGFEKSDNGEKITLPDHVDIDTLVEFKNFLQESNMKTKLNDESFWPCNHCTYHNPIELKTCQMCGLPRNVCVNPREIFHSKQKLHSCFVCTMFVKKKSRIIL